MEIGHQEALWPGCMAHSYKRIFKDRINRTEGGFMLGNVRKKFIGDKQFYKMVLAIAIPIMIQNGITNFVSLLDNIMVGQIGTEQMSGVAIVNQLIFVCTSLWKTVHAGDVMRTAGLYDGTDICEYTS